MTTHTIRPHPATQAAANVKLLLLDVDGVMTDGSIQIDDLGHETGWQHGKVSSLECPQFAAQLFAGNLDAVLSPVQLSQKHGKKEQGLLARLQVELTATLPERSEEHKPEAVQPSPGRLAARRSRPRLQFSRHRRHLLNVFRRVPRHQSARPGRMPVVASL